MNNASLEQLIVTVSNRGDGKVTPIRGVTQYWSKDGKLLAESDPCAEVITPELVEKILNKHGDVAVLPAGWLKFIRGEVAHG